jgi:hypothetical protein
VQKREQILQLHSLHYKAWRLYLIGIIGRASLYKVVDDGKRAKNQDQAPRDLKRYISPEVVQTVRESRLQGHSSYRVLSPVQHMSPKQDLPFQAGIGCPRKAIEEDRVGVAGCEDFSCAGRAHRSKKRRAQRRQSASSQLASW